MAFKFLVLAVCVTVATCAEYYNPILTHKPHGYLRPAYHTPLEKEALIDRRDHRDHHHVPHYKYDYGVQDPYTGDIKAQQELREGDLTSGYYTVNQPDGTKRIVKYKADPYSGFNAEVEYTGQAIHPVPVKQVPVGVPVKTVPVPVKQVVVPVKTVPVPVKAVPVAAKAAYPYGYERIAAPVAYEESYY